MFAFASMPALATTSTASRTASAKKKKKKKKKRRAVAKRRSKRGKQVAAVASDGHVSNMPAGWAWPPNAAMKTAARTCEDELTSFGLAWEAAPREGKIAAPVVVPEMEIGGIKYKSVYKKPPFTMDCHLVRVLAAIGPELRAIGVREIKFGSIYRNTNVRAHGQTKNILSRHALGLAMDIKDFVDASGRDANVELDYLKGDQLLHNIEDVINKSNKFRIVLTPGNDPLSHYDHFHVEASVDYSAFR